MKRYTTRVHSHSNHCSSGSGKQLQHKCLTHTTQPPNVLY